jgi:hypothetical protein
MRSSTQTKMDRPIKKRKLNVITLTLTDLFDHEYSLAVEVIKNISFVDFISLISSCKHLNLLMTKRQYFEWILDRATKYFIKHLNKIDPNIIPFLIKRRGVIAGGSVLRAITRNPLHIDTDIDMFLSCYRGELILEEKIHGETVYYLGISDSKIDKGSWIQIEGIVGGISIDLLFQYHLLPIVESHDTFKRHNMDDILQVHGLEERIPYERSRGNLKFLKTKKMTARIVGNAVVQQFDQTCCQCFFDGKRIFSTNIESQLRMESKFIRQAYMGSEIEEEHLTRIEKYKRRGFNVVV